MKASSQGKRVLQHPLFLGVVQVNAALVSAAHMRGIAIKIGTAKTKIAMRANLVEEIDSETLVYRQELGGRIAQAVNSIGTKAAAATAARVTPEQLNKWLKGAVKVPVEAVRTISRASGVDFSWIVTGEGEMLQAQVTGRQPHALASPTDLDQPGMIRLPVYREVHASAGPGAVPAAELADGVISFDRRFLRDQGAVPEFCSVIWAKGDSMMPTIPDGSALVVDRSQIDIADGCIMVIGIGDSLLVKRVQRRTNGEIRLISDNKDYEPETLGPHELQQLRVVGRVVYFGRTP